MNLAGALVYWFWMVGSVVAVVLGWAAALVLAAFALFALLGVFGPLAWLVVMIGVILWVTVDHRGYCIKYLTPSALPEPETAFPEMNGR